jgi:hypothetical protein
MNLQRILVALAATAVFAAVVYIARDVAHEPAAAPPADESARQTQPQAAASAPSARGSADQRPAPADPRLAALMVSPPNALIEFLADPQGRVIKEVDNDPNSPAYRKPLREYSYAGDQVIRLVKYQYSGDETQIVTADVIYRADGSIDQLRESTRYEYAKQ